MTEADVIAHWRKGAREEIQSAKLLHEGGKQTAALFHCHLAVEKALKALYMEQQRKEAPFTHDLTQLAIQIQRPWTEDEKRMLADLTGFAVAARYDDLLWAENEATAANVLSWIHRVDMFLPSILP
ncbi:MAG: HEPN domain-containing protein [Candidatus Peribacter sp.]|nr:HEPN domain-containing protein [Candidatus Peribacter sp.]